MISLFFRYVFFISTRCFDRWHAILVFYFVPLNHSHISNRPSPSPMEDLSARIKNLEVRIRAGEKDETDTKTKTRVHPLFCVPRIFIFILEKKKTVVRYTTCFKLSFTKITCRCRRRVAQFKLV